MLEVWASLVAQRVRNPAATQETLVQFLGREDPLEKGQATYYSWASLGAQVVKNLQAMKETWTRSLSWEDPLEEGVATHSSLLAWRIPLDREAWPPTVREGAERRTRLSD